MKPKKHYSQNFLQDSAILAAIVDAIDPQPNDNIVEIGPGLGALTTLLLPRCQQLTAIEIDTQLIPKLRAACLPNKNFKLYNADALQFDYSQLLLNSEKLRMVGNLPYHISTPLLFHFITQLHVIQDISVMLQQEVVARMAATPGNHAYGRLTVMLQYHCQVEPLLTIPATAFFPVPQVNSAFVKLTPHVTKSITTTDYKLWQKIVAQAFSQRRKTLRNSLRRYVTVEQLQQLQLDPQLRAEQLTVQDYVRISNFCSSVGF